MKRSGLGLLLVAVALIASIALRSRTGSSQAQTRSEPTTAPASTAMAPTPAPGSSASPTPSRSLDLSSIRSEEEQHAVTEAVKRIDDGGPFDYDKDGSTFRNAERRLPTKGRSYYREYTVKTPGAHNRGARRIIAGDGGELYYTNDHYLSFALIRREKQ